MSRTVIKEGTFADMFCQESPMRKVLPLLLKDQTTGKNIVWATDTYKPYGNSYNKECQMFPDFNINLIMEGILLPRIHKTKEQKQSRTKAKAEVFTPSWICNCMNNFCDEQWFSRKNVFNTEVNNGNQHTWTVNPHKIEFDADTDKRLKEWQKYVDSRRIEITCGEAPYIVSRYDTTTGEQIPIRERIGFLDRKLRIVDENTEDENEWFQWAVRAYEATYGFEYQGDNLFFARVNLVQTFIDYYEQRFGKAPEEAMIEKIATIVSWNVWQMDGLRDTAPFGIPDDEETKEKDNKPVYCTIKDWRSNEVIEYRSMKGSE